MDAKKFRIGNIVKAKTTNDEFNIVQEIGFSDTQRGYYLRLENVNHGVWIEHNGEYLIEGIPLTKKWLLKCGFEELNDKYYMIYLGKLTLRYLYTHSGGNWHFEIEDEMVDIHFVHEFQNLFFAITGRELELKTDV